MFPVNLSHKVICNTARALIKASGENIGSDYLGIRCNKSVIAFTSVKMGSILAPFHHFYH